MPDPYAVAVAARVQQQLRRLLGREQVTVRPYGKRLFIQLDRGDGVATVARLTRHHPNQYGLDFRTRLGRWEPFPEEGTLRQMTEAAASQLGPYRTPDRG